LVIFFPDCFKLSLSYRLRVAPVPARRIMLHFRGMHIAIHHDNIRFDCTRWFFRRVFMHIVIRASFSVGNAGFTGEAALVRGCGYPPQAGARAGKPGRSGV
jgi:hypothetical protein